MDNPHRANMAIKATSRKSSWSLVMASLLFPFLTQQGTRPPLRGGSCFQPASLVFLSVSATVSALVDDPFLKVVSQGPGNTFG